MLFVNRRVFLINLLIYIGAYVLIWILNTVEPFGYTMEVFLSCLKWSGLGALLYGAVCLVAWLFGLNFYIIRLVGFMCMWIAPYSILTDSEMAGVSSEFDVPSPYDIIIALYGVAAFITMLILYLNAPRGQNKEEETPVIDTDVPPSPHPPEAARESCSERVEEREDTWTHDYGTPYGTYRAQLTLVHVLEDGQRISCHVTPQTLAEMPGQVAKIGRSPECHLRFTNRSVSRRHMRLGCDNDGYWIEDEGSYAGTLVNGVKYDASRRVRLRDGDRLQLGSVVLYVQIPDETIIEREHACTEPESTEYESADSPFGLKGKPEDYIQRLVLGIGAGASRELRHEDLVQLPGKVAVLGSAEDTYIRLQGQGIGSYHLIIGSECPGQFWIMDNGFPTGTYINGVRCNPRERYELQDGACLRLGELEIVTELDFNAKQWT